MNRFLSSIGLLLGLWTFGSLIGMFADLERITFWGIGFGSGVGLLMVWAPVYLFYRTRPRSSETASPSTAASPSPLQSSTETVSEPQISEPYLEERTHPATWVLGVLTVGALFLFMFSFLQVIVLESAGWANIGIAAFAVLVIAGPLLILVQGLTKVPANRPSPDTAQPFIPQEAVPFATSENPASSTEDHDKGQHGESGPLEWPYASSVENEENFLR